MRNALFDGERLTKHNLHVVGHFANRHNFMSVLLCDCNNVPVHAILPRFFCQRHSGLNGEYVANVELRIRVLGVFFDAQGRIPTEWGMWVIAVFGYETVQNGLVASREQTEISVDSERRSKTTEGCIPIGMLGKGDHVFYRAMHP